LAEVLGKPLSPGSTIGILGGGQLGRMLAQAAAQLGLKCHIFCPEKTSPAFEVAASKTAASYNDQDALKAFADSVDAITYEFENIPSETAEFLQKLKPMNPGPKALQMTQDRIIEKRFLRDLAIPVPAFAPVDTLDDLQKALIEIGTPAVLKTRRMGYDGKGQAVIREDTSPEEAFLKIGKKAAILEAFVPFEREVSIIMTTDMQGESWVYAPSENSHENGILSKSHAPAHIHEDTEVEAIEIAGAIAEALNYVGTLAVEFFVTRDQQLLVNEIAPRVHNSGHWTLDACVTSQFENHIRAIAGWPLGSTRHHSAAEMTNLIGPDHDRWLELAADPEVNLHLYGKKEARPGRKMGHMTRLTSLAIPGPSANDT
jgi:5-(carboxyamino)imidazole ribonucleotide synthase